MGQCSSVRAVGIDDNTWVRCSTFIPVLSSASIREAKYWSIFLWADNIYYAYVDCVQLEKNQLTDYKESPFVRRPNIAPNLIDGNILSWDTIKGKHLYGQALYISNNDIDGNKIVVGEYSTDANYTILTPTYMKYHASSLPTAGGFSYTKHVESGFANYDSTIAFEHRFVDIFGDPYTPHVIVSPNLILTYDSNYPNYSQVIQTQIEATPGGLYVNAYLRKTFNLINVQKNFYTGDYHIDLTEDRDDYIWGYQVDNEKQHTYY